MIYIKMLSPENIKLLASTKNTLIKIEMEKMYQTRIC